MEERRIVWDEAKNVENRQKHKISFEVAQYVFTEKHERRSYNGYYRIDNKGWTKDS